MVDDETRRKGTIEVKKGSAGPAKRMDPAERAGRADKRPTERQLDARQERIPPKRRRGPKLPPPDNRTRALESVADVPETECDEPDAERENADTRDRR
jgi:hypothetical protein